MRRLAFLFHAHLACGGTQKDTDNEIEQDPIEFEDPEGAGDAPVATEHLTIVPMTITDGQNEILLKEDGSVEAGGQKLASMNVKGEFLAANGGLYATLNQDGTITGSHVPTEKFNGITIDEKGTIRRGETALATVEEGTLRSGETAFLKFEGPEGGYRAATFIYVMLAVLQGQPPVPEPAPTEGEGEGEGDGEGGDASTESTETTDGAE
jgi:hypothetical protein